MSNNTENLQKAIQSYNDELATYTLKNNKSNSTRVRNSLMVVNKLTKLCRSDILATQKAIPKKIRVKKEVAVVEEEVVETPVAPVKKQRAKKI
jgi:hypothetical protein